MALQVMWAACNITHPDTGEDHIIHRGALLPNWAFDDRLEFMRSALVMTGALQVVDDPAQAAPATTTSAKPADPPAPPATTPSKPASPTAKR